MSTRAEAVAVAYECPECGGPHSRAEHGVRDLDADGLWYLRRRVTVEILRAVRADADHDTLEPMLALLDGIDSRLHQLAEHASLERPQRVADKGPSRKLGGRHSNGLGADTTGCDRVHDGGPA